MGERGPAPEPIALRVLKGTNHKPIPENTAAVAQMGQQTSSPECPDWLLPKAKAEWYSLVELMEKVPGWLTEVNKTTLAGHCQWYAIWMEAEEILMKEGRFYDAALGVDPEDGEVSAVKKLHPMVRVSKEAWLAMVKCDQELGITPARGSAVKIPTGDRDDESGLDHPGRTG